MFLIQSTTTDEHGNAIDVVFNPDEEKLQLLQFSFKNYGDKKTYNIRIETNDHKARENHYEESIARKRIEEILIAFGGDAEEAKAISSAIVPFNENKVDGIKSYGTYVPN